MFRSIHGARISEPMNQDNEHADQASREGQAAHDAARPLVSMLLITYNQAGVIADAIAGALAQTYSPLEILISDDCSSDATWAAVEAATRDYRGPHRLVLNRNERNAGITAHLSQLAAMSHGARALRASGRVLERP
jgi:cellulose synthase/poly-beta-1,6-N-acetylglucosamine synthase-like glycosyltransferase